MTSPHADAESRGTCETRILLAAHEAELLKPLAEAISARGYSVRCVGGGAQAARLLRAEEYALAVFDTGAPRPGMLHPGSDPQRRQAPDPDAHLPERS